MGNNGRRRDVQMACADSAQVSGPHQDTPREGKCPFVLKGRMDHSY